MKKLEYVKYKMTGIERKPIYMKEKCFYFVSLSFKSMDKDHPDLKIPWIVVGKKDVDENLLNSLRCKLYSITKSHANENYIFNDAFIILAIIGNEIVGIGNSEMSRFLLADNLLGPIKTKVELENHSNLLLEKDLKIRIEKFLNSLNELSDFTDSFTSEEKDKIKIGLVEFLEKIK